MGKHQPAAEKPSDELRQDHQLLRAELGILEQHLRALRGARSTVSRLTDSLASCLRFHIERQARLLARLASRGQPVPAAAIQQFSDEHENQRTRLAILHEFLARQNPVADEQIVAQASEIIDDLRSHLAEEEQHFFPAIDGKEPSGERGQHEAVGFLGVP